MIFSGFQLTGLASISLHFTTFEWFDLVHWKLIHYKDEQGSKGTNNQPRFGQDHPYPTSRLPLIGCALRGDISSALDQHRKPLGGAKEEQEEIRWCIEELVQTFLE